MAVTTKYTFPNAVGQNGQSATTFANHGIENFNQANLDVYVTLSGGTRVLQLLQSTGSTAIGSGVNQHPQVNNTDGLYFPAVEAGTTLYNYTLSADFNTINFSTTLPDDAVVSVERRTRDENGTYTNFTSGSSIRSKEINNAFDESNHTAQEARNKAFDLENKVVYSDFTPAEDNTKDLGSSTKEWKDLYIDGVAYVDELDLEDNEKIKLGSSDGDSSIYYDGSDLIAETNSVLVKTTGNQEFMVDGVVRFTINDGNDSVQTSWPIVPMQDGVHDLGTTNLEWNDLWIDGTAHIDTLDVDINATVAGTLGVTGDATFNGDTTLGDNAGDKVYLKGRINQDIVPQSTSINLGQSGANRWGTAYVTTLDADTVASNLIPSVDANYNLGSSTKEWQNLYLDGIAYVDELNLADNEKVRLGDTDGDFDIYFTDATSGQAYIETSGRPLNLKSGLGLINFRSAGDDVLASFNASSGCIFYKNVIPDEDDHLDLGVSSLQWRDLFVDGTGYIDTVSADDITGDAVVTSGTSTSDTKVYSAKHTEALFLRQDSTETLASGIAWSSNDTTVPTTGAIDARVRGLITDVGGFRPIASEAVFPTTNPDPDDNAGTIVSITALSADRTASGTTLTAGCQTTGGTQVTITGCPNNQVFKAGYGLLVETTSTLNTYTFVRYVADTSSVATVAAKATEIGLLGTADAVADMNTLGTAAVVEDMNLLGTTACVADMALLGDSAVIADMAILATTDVVADLNTLGTADVVSDLNTLATADVVSDMNTLATADVVSDMNTLATAAIVSDMDTLADISANITTVATNNANVTTCATNIASINNAPTHAANALAYRNTTETYRNTAEAHRNTASGILTQVESAPYNLSDSASTHTAWGNITDTGGNAVFSNETSNTLLTMSEGSSTYNYGSIT